VVFCEDIDRAILAGERSVKMDDILNIIDGIDSKYSNIIVVLTTNELEKIHAAMLRPGRLDAVVEVTKPDAKAVEKLLRIYGKDVIAAEVDLTRAGQILQGNIPAVIAEVIKRVKLSQLKFQEPGSYITKVGEQAVIDAAETMQQQIELLERAINGQPDTGSKLENALKGVVQQAMKEDTQDVKETARLVEGVAKRVGVK
jgi:transitional endoplasmic reticulum ATPase